MAKYMKDFFGKTVSRLLWFREGEGYYVSLRQQRKRPNRSERVTHGAAIYNFRLAKDAEKFYRRFNTKEAIIELLHSSTPEAEAGRELYRAYHTRKWSAESDNTTLL